METQQTGAVGSGDSGESANVVKTESSISGSIHASLGNATQPPSLTLSGNWNSTQIRHAPSSSATGPLASRVRSLTPPPRPPPPTTVVSRVSRTPPPRPPPPTTVVSRVSRTPPPRPPPPRPPPPKRGPHSLPPPPRPPTPRSSSADRGSTTSSCAAPHPQRCSSAGSASVSNRLYPVLPDPKTTWLGSTGSTTSGWFSDSSSARPSAPLGSSSGKSDSEVSKKSGAAANATDQSGIDNLSDEPSSSDNLSDEPSSAESSDDENGSEEDDQLTEVVIHQQAADQGRVQGAGQAHLQASLQTAAQPFAAQANPTTALQPITGPHQPTAGFSGTPSTSRGRPKRSGTPRSGGPMVKRKKRPSRCRYVESEGSISPTDDDAGFPSRISMRHKKPFEGYTGTSSKKNKN